jgi:hypothetical protein
MYTTCLKVLLVYLDVFDSICRILTVIIVELCADFEFSTGPADSVLATRRLNQYEPSPVPVPSPDPPPPDVPDDIVDAIEQIISGDADPPPGLVVEATPTGISVTVPEGSPPPTEEQTAEIAVAAAKSITLPGGGTPATQTKYNLDGSITIVVYLNQTARQTIQRWYLGRVAAARNNQTVQRGRSLLQTQTGTKVTYIVVGTNKAEVASYQKQLDATLSNPEKMSEISNSVIEGSSSAAVVEPTVPIISCSYVGHFTISPLYAPCNRHFLAYVYPNCQNTDVNLRTKRQLGGKRSRAYWQMLGSYKAPNNTISTTIEAIERRKCPTKYFEASSLDMGSTPSDWIITPAQKKDDCTVVNIYSVSKQAYLNAPRSCSSLGYVSGDGGRSRFRVLRP